MKVYLKNKAEVTLSQSDFVASGGEGSIYKKGNTAYKIYQDKSKAIPVGKINELAVLNNPRIINPKEPVFDNSNQPIGYTMPLVNKSIPLCKLFTKSFKDTNHLSFESIVKLINTFKKDIEDVHNNNILIVDLNELNFLVNEAFTEVMFIDVDSYQTSHYPATVLMDSIKYSQYYTFEKDKKKIWYDSYKRKKDYEECLIQLEAKGRLKWEEK